MEYEFLGHLTKGEYRSECIKICLKKQVLRGQISLIGQMPLSEYFRKAICDPKMSQLYRFENAGGDDFDLYVGGGRNNLLADKITIQSSGRVPLDGAKN